MATLDALCEIPSQKEASIAIERNRRESAEANLDDVKEKKKKKNENKEKEQPKKPSNSPKKEGQSSVPHTAVKVAEEIKKLKRANYYLTLEMSTRKKSIDEFSAKLSDIVNDSIDVRVARELTYKALRKGRALQSLSQILLNNSVQNQSVKDGYDALSRNAFMSKHAPKVLSYTDSNMRLFRQEQLVLLAENDRLIKELKSLRAEVTGKSVVTENQEETEYLQKHEKGGGKQTSPQESKKASVDSSGGVVELDPDVVGQRFQTTALLLIIGQLRLMSFAFRKILDQMQFLRGTQYVEFSQETMMMHKARNNFITFRQIMYTIECRRLLNVRSAFWMIYAHAQSRSDCRVCLGYHAQHINNAIGNQINIERPFFVKQFTVNPPPYVTIYPKLRGNMAFACQPHYYDNLPSLRQDERRKSLGMPSQGYLLGHMK